MLRLLLSQSVTVKRLWSSRRKEENNTRKVSDLELNLPLVELLKLSINLPLKPCLEPYHSLRNLNLPNLKVLFDCLSLLIKMFLKIVFNHIFLSTIHKIDFTISVLFILYYIRNLKLIFIYFYERKRNSKPTIKLNFKSIQKSISNISISSFFRRYFKFFVSIEIFI